MSAADEVLAAPVLTLPAAEAERLRAAYSQATTILEYGSGGSTVLAAGMAGKRIFSVESDANWCADMEKWFAANPPASPVVMHHADVGPTRKWGMPRDDTAFRRWPSYALGIWDHDSFVAPDLVLIDGRFRPACFFATLFRTARPVTVLWDDYTDRPQYHYVERFAAPVATHGRMAEFHLTPQMLRGEDLGRVVAAFLEPK